MKNNYIKATIFIPTYNGEQYIGDILSSIYNQKTDFLYDVFIIDSGSKDRTIEIINSYAKKHKNLILKEIPNSEFGHGKTRNLGAHMAKGEFVVYLSHDAIPSHNRWLYEILKPFEISEKIVGVMGKQIPRINCSPLLRYEIQTVFKNFGPDFGTTIFYKDDFVQDQGLYDAISFYSDVNSAARRSFLVDKLPYRDVPYAEDQMFGRDVIDAGYCKAYAPRASVVHSNDLKLNEYKKRMFDETVGMRKLGVKINTPSIKNILKMIFFGSINDCLKIVKDAQYSKKRKMYWFLVNPLFHIEKWRGVRLGASIDLKDADMLNKHSLEKKRQK